MPQSIDLRDDRLSWQGVIDLHYEDGWVQPWRVPYAERGLFFQGLVEGAAKGAGARLAFRTDARELEGDCEAGGGKLDLIVNHGEPVSFALEGQTSFRFGDLPAGEKIVELWTPQAAVFRLKSLKLPDGASLKPYADERPKWITYGSSITHCGAAASPAQTWPAVAARGANLNLTCLGFGGQCHLDSLMARIMRDRPADYLSIKVGINIYGAKSLGPRGFRQAIVGFVKIVREKHPQTPFVVCSPIWSPPRETEANAVGFTLQGMRAEVEEAVAALQAHGDKHLHYVNGLDLFGPELKEFLPDNLHPDAEGYRRLGRNFLEKAARKYFV
ncbi:MAG: GDSL-type esterase/lipase family protein [Planctomycetota bacterium]|nr:GDSL-type esterase/lipase family protein [Planctomycetota bacterium]